MRALILAASVVSLASCGDSGEADNTASTDENLTVERIVANDITAIDAVTADAANMAADVDFTNEMLNATGNEAAPGARQTRTRSSATPPARRSSAPPAARPSPAPAQPAEENTAGNNVE